MTFLHYKNLIENSLKEIIKELKYEHEDLKILETSKTEFGNVYTNIALILAKKYKEKPIDIAKKIDNLFKESEIRIQIKEPGYINFFVDENVYNFRVLKESIKENFSYPNIGNNQNIILEHTSVNPNKALHIGHARNLIIGDTMYRILKKTNYNVTVINYIDNVGLQIADLIVGFKHLNFEIEPKNNIKFDEYAGNQVYVKVNEMYEKEPELLEKRKIILKELEEKNETAKLGEKITKRILQEQLKTADRLGAKYDLLVYESDILKSGMWTKIFQEMKKESIISYEKEGELKGTWAIKGISKNIEEKVILRSDGTATYIAKDIPFAAWKLGIIDNYFKYKIFLKYENGRNLLESSCDKKAYIIKKMKNDIAITIIDSRQSELQNIIRKVLERLTKKDLKNKYIHLGYEIVRLSSQTVSGLGIEQNNDKTASMSGRKGIFVNVDECLNLIKQKTKEETKKRNTSENESWVEKVSESLAISAFRYEIIKQDLNKIVTFDLKNALKLDGDTGPYILYANARSIRILEKSKEIVTVNKEFKDVLETNEEKKLIIEISKMTLRIKEAVDNSSPKILAKYAYNLSSTFNSFYEKHRVLDTKDQELKMARLALVLAFNITIQRIGELLGLKMPNKI